MTYVTKQGDVLDEIVFKYYGRTSGYVEMVLAENRHLAELGPVYKADVAIVLPTITANAEIKTEITIWT